MDELKARNCEVTQATLSRDLKTLRTSKVVTEMGGYRYVIAANGTAADEVATHAIWTAFVRRPYCRWRLRAISR